MSRKKELVFNTAIIGIGKFGTQVLSFFLLPMYTSVLTTREYGIYDLIITSSLFAVPIITLLLEESMFRFLIDCKTDSEKSVVISHVARYIIKNVIIFSIIVCIIGVFVKKIDVYIALLYIISAISITSINAIVRGLGKLKIYSMSNFLNSLLVIILNIIFILKFKWGYRSLLYSTMVMNILCSLIVSLKLGLFKYINIQQKDKRLIKEMKRYSIPLVPNSISWSIINVSDRLIISGFLGTAANGVYSMANKFPQVMDSIYGFFYTAWKESAAKALKDDDSNNFYDNIYHILKNVLFSIVVGMCACMPFVFKILIKNEFQEAYMYIPILILAMYYSNMSGFYGGIFSAYKDTKVMGYTTMISAAINLIVNIICIKFIGIWAAAASTLIATFIVYFIRKNKMKNMISLSKDSLIIRILKVISILITGYTYYSTSITVHVICFAFVLMVCCIINKKLVSTVIEFVKNKNRK